MTKWPLDIAVTKQKAPARELRPRNRLQKQPSMVEILSILIISRSSKDANIQNIKLKIWNSEVPMSMIKANSKVYKLQSFDKAVNNSIYGQH